MKKLDLAAAILVLVGAFNWGCVGLFDLNVIDAFVENKLASRLIFALIGIAGIYRLIYWKSILLRWRVES